MTTQIDRRFDFSGGIQNATTWQLRKPNEVENVINGRFNDVIGAITRRLGYTQEGATLQSGKRGLGLHEAKWDTGAKVLAAINDSGDTETKIKIYDNGAATWSNLSLPATVDVNTRMQMIDSIGETYIAGRSTSTGTRMAILNVIKTPTVSATRNLINAPTAKFIAEYGGCLYAMNVKVGSTVYADRAYRSSPPLGVVTFTQGDQDVFDVLAVDSVRYIKASMAFDIYTAGTSTKTHDITVTSVDKAADTLTYSGFSTATTFATGDVNTGTEVITIGRNLTTGTPIKFTTTTTIPAGLVVGTVYYAINVSATTIKVATSSANATAGTAVDITSTGAGTHTITSGVHIPDNTELWLDGRFGDLSYLWNTDYPTDQTADYLRIPPGFDSDTEITGWGKSNNRLDLFTKNSMYKWDNANLITVYEDIGCIAHETIQNIGDWLIWLDSDGKVRARNDATGQDELISKPVQNLLRTVPAANLPDAAAGRTDNVYKLCLGTVDGSTMRLCYDFDSNSWAHEIHALAMTNHMRSDMDGSKKTYFLSTTGKLFTDETGLTDDGVTIPFIIKFGRSNQTVEQLKNYHGVYIYAVNIAGATVKVCLDGAKDFKPVGQLKQEVEKIPFSGIGGQFSGRDINMEISINSDGESPRIDGLAYYFSQEEDKFGQPTKR